MCESFLSLLLNLHQRKRQLFVKIIEFLCVIAFFRHFIACFPFFLIHLVLSLLSISSQISDLFNEAVLDSFACFFVFVLMDFHCLSHQFQMTSYILKEFALFPYCGCFPPISELNWWRDDIIFILLRHLFDTFSWFWDWSYAFCCRDWFIVCDYVVTLLCHLFNAWFGSLGVCFFR